MPEALDVLIGSTWRLILEPWRLTMEPRKLVEPWRVFRLKVADPWFFL
jgi:UDP-N-acetyl-D-mannosaminuronic acid transferase (WecB/TagA/CpsF family)